ncbi:MAG: hypothetical protein ABIH59_00295 [archaeon]
MNSQIKSSEKCIHYGICKNTNKCNGSGSVSERRGKILNCKSHMSKNLRESMRNAGLENNVEEKLI